MWVCSDGSWLVFGRQLLGLSHYRVDRSSLGDVPPSISIFETPSGRPDSS